MAERQLNVLFVCTGNAGRSQIAQAMARRRFGDRMCVESAGVAPWDHLHPMAVKVMAERGMDLSGHRPKGVPAVSNQRFNVVVTIGTPAKQQLPADLPGNPQRVHWAIDDPADADGTERSESVFRHTAGLIEQRMADLADLLNASA